MAPGVNGLGRQTGTVPKTKTHNDSARDYSAAVRRDQMRSNIPNNLASHDWQPISDPGRSRTRKTSNTRTATLDYFDLVSDGSVSHDNSRFATTQFSQADNTQGSWSVINRHTVDINGCSPSAASLGSKRDLARRTPRNIMPDKENKSNITKMPDRNQVATRLNQIRDYIHQTSSLMDTLKSSGDSRHQAQYHKLASMVDDLRDSEDKLQNLLVTLDRVAVKIEMCDKEDQENDVIVQNGAAESIPDSRNSLPAARTPGSQSRSSVCLSTGSPASSQGNSEELSGAVLKSSDSTRRNELKMKVEESQRKLQALQEHQAALLSLQQKAQDQLNEARAAQGVLLSRATAPYSNEEENTGDNLQENVENIQDRLHALHELYENRNQLVALMGERDEELVSEHLVLQNKLQELQSKKQHMDHLVAEFQSLNNLPASTGLQMDGGTTSSQEGSEDGSDLEMDCQMVRDKMSELNSMKAQLAQLQNLMRQTEMDTGQESSGPVPIQHGASPSHQIDIAVQPEDQAVNLRRQQRDKGCASLARTNSNASNSKPDNITQAGSEGERSRDLDKKSMKLQEAKARLQQLQELLSAVTDMRGRGEPVPVHYLELLAEETEHECDMSGGDAGRNSQESQPRRDGSVSSTVNAESQHDSPNELTLDIVQAMARDLRQQTQSLQEERDRLVQAQRELGKLQRDLPLPLREKKTNTQVDALQAKRRELEELMRKDQGQTSSINQDVCSELSAGKSETPGYSYLGEGTSNATWGGSTQGTLDDLAERDDDVQEQSAGYSSDEGQDADGRSRVEYLGSQLKHLQLNTTTSSSNNNNNNKDALVQTATTNRDILSMSLESGVFGNVHSNHGGHSNATSVTGSTPAPPSQPCRGPQRPSPHNVWRKASTDSNATVPRAVWTPSSQHLNTADEQGVNHNNSNLANNEIESNISNTTMQHIPSQTSACSNSNWWQQHAIQLQSQLEVTSNLYQSLLLEQQQQQASLQWSPPLPAMPWRLPATGTATTGISGDNNTFYQQLLAASHLQQQQVLLTTMNQCCHLLWLQQREMATLRTAVMALQDKVSRSSGGLSPSIALGQPMEDSVLGASVQTSSQHTPHQSQSNLARLPPPPAPHQALKVSYSGGLFQLPEELAGGTVTGVSSAHSLPNLSQAPVSSLIQCSIPPPPPQVQSTTGSPWLPAAHSNASPVPALNNQVPPGNRANNYWDNFRSYSRQNLLSTSTKSNEGMSHSPSPLVDRSHNTLRSSVAVGLQPGTSSQAVHPSVDPGLPIAPHNISRKEKLNNEPYQSVGDNYVLGASGVLEAAELQYQLLGSTGRTQSQNEYQLQIAGTEPEISQPWLVRPNTKTARSQRGNCKRKNPRPMASLTQDQVNHLSTSGTLVSNSPQDRNIRKSGLFDVLSESVYTEVAALIAANEERPHFLIQLFRDLQMVSSDPLRRRTLQSIHELVSRYLAAANANGTGDGLQREQNTTQVIANEYTGSNSLASSEEDDNINLASGSTPRREALGPTTASGENEPQLVLQDAIESEGGAAAGLPPSPRAPPRNVAWNNKDTLTLPVELPGRCSKLDWEVQAVLVDVLPFLKAHLDEPCSPALLESIRTLTVQLVPSQTRTAVGGVNQGQPAPVAQHQLIGGYFQGQLDALLEDALHKFIGCRLRDVGEELLTVIAEIVQSELTFLRLVDTVQREVDDSSEGICKNPPIRESDSEEPTNCLAIHLATESAAQPFPVPATNNQNLLEPLSGGPQAYNGDLAEADQSHHEDATAINTSPVHRTLYTDSEGAGAAAAAALPQGCDNSLSEVTEQEQGRADEHDCITATLTGEDNEEQIKTEVGSCWQAEDEWEVEQDREQGLDRVPTRLTDEPEPQDRQTAGLSDAPNP